MSRPSHDGRWLESSCQSCQVVMAQNYWLELLRVRRAVNGLEPGCSGADIVPVRSRGLVEPAVSQHSPVPSDDDEPQAPPMKRQNTTVLETLASAYADRHGGLPAEVLCESADALQKECQGPQSLAIWT